MSRARLLQLLGLPASATLAQIKARYHELARRLHPDVNVGDDKAHARFRALVAAYQELLVAEAEAPERDADAGVVPATARDASPADHTAAAGSGQPARPADAIARRRVELQARLALRTKTLHVLQMNVRDGDAKALAARGRGNEQMARHFERRVEADRSRVYALLGEISGIELELRGIEARHGGDGHGGAAAVDQVDRVELLSRDVRKAHDEERAVLERTYDPRGKQR